MSDQRLDILATVKVDRSGLEQVKTAAGDAASEVKKANAAAKDIQEIKENARGFHTEIKRDSSSSAESVNGLGDAFKSLSSRGGEVRETLEGVSMASEGGARGMFGLAKSVQALWSTLTSANTWIVITTALAAGVVALGTYIKRLWDAGNATADFSQIEKNAAENTAHLNNRLAEVGKLSLKETQKELEALSKNLTRSSEDTERLIRTQAALRGAKSDMDAARIKIAEARGDLTPEAAAWALADLTHETALGNINADENNARTAKSDARHREVMTEVTRSAAKKKNDAAQEAFQTSLRDLTDWGRVTAEEEQAALAGTPGALDKALQRRQVEVAQKGAGDVNNSIPYLSRARRELNASIEAGKTFAELDAQLKSQIEEEQKKQRASDEVLGLIPSRRETADLSHVAAISGLQGPRADSAKAALGNSFYVRPGFGEVRDDEGNVVDSSTKANRAAAQTGIQNALSQAERQLESGANSKEVLARTAEVLKKFGALTVETQAQVAAQFELIAKLSSDMKAAQAQRSFGPAGNP